MSERVYVDRVRPNFSEETLPSGVTVARWFLAEGERYRYDHKLLALGWQQWDTEQDAWYYGVWVHPARYEVFSYAEGDCTQTFCELPALFRAELQRMLDFHGAPPPAFIELDLTAGTRTDHYSKRLKPEDVP